MIEPQENEEEALALALRLGLEECERLRAKCQVLEDQLDYQDQLRWLGRERA